VSDSLDRARAAEAMQRHAHSADVNAAAPADAAEAQRKAAAHEAYLEHLRLFDEGPDKTTQRARRQARAIEGSFSADVDALTCIDAGAQLRERRSV
jgi:hypothetical protein